jgi:hypothetical protein
MRQAPPASPESTKSPDEILPLVADYLAAQHMPTAVGRIRREHVEAFVSDLLARKAPATAHNRFRGCQAFFNWLTEEGEVRVSPWPA